jgi:type II secretory pathway pseudopilin PulG
MPNGNTAPAQIRNPQSAIRNGAAFTLIEIAICLAIIGFALIAIIGVLPYGLNTQRDVREETIINQDATVLMEAIRNGARQSDYLTNYVYAITNYWQDYDNSGVPQNSGTDGYTYTDATIRGNPYPYLALTNGANILGVLSLPEFTDGWGGIALADTSGRAYVSNRVVAYVRSISGLAVEKPPQNNQIMREDALTYRLLCVNAPMPVDTNTFARNRFAQKLAGSQRELRLTFLWPQLPNGKVGNSRLTFRATVGGQVAPTNYYGAGTPPLYFYQPQSFPNAP